MRGTGSGDPMSGVAIVQGPPRTAVLEQDLVRTPDEGKAEITQDELGNTYDRVGGPYSNFQP